MGAIGKLLSAGAGRQLGKYRKCAELIGTLGEDLVGLSDSELRAKTDEFRERHAAGESLDHILPDAFAVVREASSRVLGMRHYDVQLIGGMVLHSGQIAEMATGEGKTLVSTLAGYLNALDGKGVHVVTVNDYLAKRDCEQMGRVYSALGMEAGLLQHGMPDEARKEAYAKDVTYGTNSEFGFDYLRDNMTVTPGSKMQRGHAFAIVDEVDSILIDEARTPLIISGSGNISADDYRRFAHAVRMLDAERDVDIDEAKKTVSPTEEGLRRVEALLGIEDIYADLTGGLSNHLQQALRARFLFKRDVDYIVVGGDVFIVDEFTGRVMDGRRYSEGLHQAIEAKEGVEVRAENQTMATVTLQNYFRLYGKLAGMTGTAKGEDSEFKSTYGLGVQTVPTNRPVIRAELPDLVYRTKKAKMEAVADDVARRHAAGQPCLVGTTSVESSEELSRILGRRGIAHSVLNAKNHEKEAAIVAQAGRVGAVTIATNMAGRGTDILLGGNPEFLATEMARERFGDEVPDGAMEAVVAEAKAVCSSEAGAVRKAGGLAVIGTERHESRRIDDQLRGRAGRQGDPGTAQFFLSLEDDLLRLFGEDRMERIGKMMGRDDDGKPIDSKMVTKAIESAQRKVEDMHAASRKRVLEYDDVMDKQRKAVYAARDGILEGRELTGKVGEIAEKEAARAAGMWCAGEDRDEWDVPAFETWMGRMCGEPCEVPDTCADADAVAQWAYDAMMGRYRGRREGIPDEAVEAVQGQIMLKIIDMNWLEQMSAMDYLKTGIGLRGNAQRDPVTEYKQEAYDAFADMVETIDETFLSAMLRVEMSMSEER